MPRALGMAKGRGRCQYGAGTRRDTFGIRVRVLPADSHRRVPFALRLQATTLRQREGTSPQGYTCILAQRAKST
jgi:hypothetical protein